MSGRSVQIRKASGEKVSFSLGKLKRSLRRSGASNQLVEQIADTVRDELYSGISTREIYNRAFALLKKEQSSYASKYKLKKALYELGPTGFPFEKFVAAIYEEENYEVTIGQVVDGACVSHEVDVIAKHNTKTLYIECKFHGEEGLKCNVKTPLYINARYKDIITKNDIGVNEGWVVTNTRFTKDALQYGSCIGLHLLSWNYPDNNGLKDRVDRLRLYPITVSTLLSHKEKSYILDKGVVLCKELLTQDHFLDYLGISESRKQRILEEIKTLCHG